MGTYSDTGKVQTTTIGNAGTYDIAVYGGSSSYYSTAGGGAQAGGDFAPTADGQNTTGAVNMPITPVAVCYVSGTLIGTARGDVPVEHLAVGDLVVTASGEHRPIRWLGHRTMDCRQAPGPRALWPVRIATHAFGQGRPSADLYLSPGHSVCVDVVDELLIPIQELVNGSTIAYTQMDHVTYWHVELDSHDILVANGLPAESFLERGANRAGLDDTAPADLPFEVLARTHVDFCREFVDGGAILAVVRAHLAARAQKLGWEEDRTVAITATVDGRSLAPILREGEVIIALPPGAAAVTVRSDMTTPAMLGDADPRTIGLAVYALELVAADGEIRRLDLDGPSLTQCFHEGERIEGLHYRWSDGDIVLPPRVTAGLAAPVMLRLAYEPSTLRGWTIAAETRSRPALRVVAQHRDFAPQAPWAASSQTVAYDAGGQAF